MTGTVVNLILAGVLGSIAIVIIYDVVTNSEPEGGWTGILAAIMPMIPVVAGVCVIVLMFMLLSKLT
jgi:uncharacterized membrane protein YcjF (UPF0283 family)